MTYFFDDWITAQQFAKEQGMIVRYVIYERKANKDSGFMSENYLDYPTAEKGNKQGVESLKRTVEDLLQKEANIEVHLVLKSYHAGHTNEMGTEPNYWVVPDYEPIEIFKPEKFLQLDI